MKKFRCHRKQVIFGAILFLLVFPLIQKHTGIVHEAGLKGAIIKPSKPGLSIRAWFDAKYQEKMEAYLNESFGLRDYFVRINNQIAFTFFRKAKANGVIIGKHNYLYERNYIKAYYGLDFIGEDSIGQRMERLKYIQDTLEKINKNIVMVLAAGKGSFYPEYFPEKYLTDRNTTNYEVYAKYAEKLGIHCIDFNRYFLEHKNFSPYPLYPQYGIHWSYYGSCLVTDSLIGYLEEKVGNRFADVSMNEIILDKARDSDYDIADGMNLIFKLKRRQMAYPKISIERDTNYPAPSVLVVADSYYWTLYGMNISKAFSRDHFWFYNKEVYPESKIQPVETCHLRLQHEIDSHDIIILLATEANLPSFGWGFIDQVYALYNPGYVNEIAAREEKFRKKVNDLVTKIRSDEKWFSSVRQKALDKGISVDSMLVLDAVWLIRQEGK